MATGLSSNVDYVWISCLGQGAMANEPGQRTKLSNNRHTGRGII